MAHTVTTKGTTDKTMILIPKNYFGCLPPVKLHHDLTPQLASQLINLLNQEVATMFLNSLT